MPSEHPTTQWARSCNVTDQIAPPPTKRAADTVGTSQEIAYATAPAPASVPTSSDPLTRHTGKRGQTRASKALWSIRPIVSAWRSSSAGWALTVRTMRQNPNPERSVLPPSTAASMETSASPIRPGSGGLAPVSGNWTPLGPYNGDTPCPAPPEHEPDNGPREVPGYRPRRRRRYGRGLSGP